MKRKTAVSAILLFMTVGWISSPHLLHAEVDWKIKKQIDLDAQPSDIATSFDGKLIFVLVPGEILIYSNSEDKVTDRIPIDKVFDRLTYSARTNELILTSSSAKTLKILQLESVHKIALSGLPFKGPENAPVTIAVFSDYQ
jgi:hypothetical protein